MTAPKICEYCGAALDAGEQCDCREEERHIDIKLSWRRPRVVTTDTRRAWDKKAYKAS